MPRLAESSFFGVAKRASRIHYQGLKRLGRERYTRGLSPGQLQGAALLSRSNRHSGQSELQAKGTLGQLRCVRHGLLSCQWKHRYPEREHQEPLTYPTTNEVLQIPL